MRIRSISRMNAKGGNKDKQLPPPSFSLTSGFYSSNEGTSQNTSVTFNVIRSGDLSGSQTVQWLVETKSTVDTVTGDDFQGGVLPNGTVSFVAGQNSAFFTLEIKGDNTVEPNETFLVRIQNPSAGTLGVSIREFVIINDDQASGGTLSQLPVPTESYVSAGVYKVGTDGIKRKQRDLFSHILLPAGLYDIEFDGTDDFKNPIPNPTDCTIEATFYPSVNGLAVEWEGSSMNTSIQVSNTAGRNTSTRHTAYYGAYVDLVEIDGVVFAIGGYSEGNPPAVWFTTASPQEKMFLKKTADSIMGDEGFLWTHHLCTDGNRVYYSGFHGMYATPQNPQHQFCGIYSVDVPTKQLYKFANTHLDYNNQFSSPSNPAKKMSDAPAGTVVGIQVTGYKPIVFGETSVWNFDDEHFPYASLVATGDTTVTINNLPLGFAGTFKLVYNGAHNVTFNGNYVGLKPTYDSANPTKEYFFQVKNVDGVMRWNYIDSKVDSVNVGSYQYRTNRYVGVAVGNTHIYAVQEARKRLIVVDKNTGQTIQLLYTYFTDATKTNSATFNKPYRIEIDRTDGTYGAMWLSQADGIYKFAIQSDGGLVHLFTISGFDDVKGIRVLGTTVWVTDGGSQNIIKKFNKATGGAIGTLGQLGGYTTSIVASNDRWIFDRAGATTDNQGGAGVWPMADGSYWLCDVGTNRVMKFNSSNALQIRVEFQGATYYCRGVIGDPSRVFSGFLEYQVDYTKTPLEGWKLHKVYNGVVPAATPLDRLTFMQITTLSNGRVYATARPHNDFVQGSFKGSNNTLFYEITATGLRYTGIVKSGLVIKFMQNGNLHETQSGGTTTRTIIEYPLTGFDANGNPQWGAGVAIATYPYNSTSVHGGLSHTMTGDGDIILFDEARPSGLTDTKHHGFHLGVIKRDPANGTTVKEPLWKGAMSTYYNYQGDYPLDNRFDIGNLQTYPGSHAFGIDDFVIWWHHGEFWKNGQTNMFHVLWKNGLQLLVYGETTANAKGKGYPKMAGNSLNFHACKVGDIYYLWSGDEGWQNALLRWKIMRADTIQTTVIPSPIKIGVKPTTKINLMEGLQIMNSDNAPDHARWKKVFGPQTTPYKWKTGHWEYKTVDIYLQGGRLGNSGNGWECTLPVTNSIAWEVGGYYRHGNNQPTLQRGTYVEVVDANRKVIVRFRHEFNGITNATTFKSVVNDASALISGTKDQWQSLVYSRNFAFKFKAVGGGNIEVTLHNQTGVYPIMDATSNWQQPAYLRMINFDVQASFMNPSGHENGLRDCYIDQNLS